MEQLRELLWLEHTYNLILFGPPGVGKTHLSVGLGLEALERGHRVSFIAMDALIHLLNTGHCTDITDPGEKDSSIRSRDYRRFYVYGHGEERGELILSICQQALWPSIHHYDLK